MKVEIQRKKWIKPATPTPSHLQKLKLSPIDRLVPPSFVQPVFYFENISTETEEVETRVVHLEESLSKVLSLYYPFAGSYDEDDECVVSCQDQGVGFVVAKVDRKLDKLVYDDEYDIKDLLSGRDTWDPLVMVQVNIFRCGGLGIGVSVPHKIGDMFTVSTFMDAWTTTCRLGTLDNVAPPSFSFSSLLPPAAAPRRTDFHLPKPPPTSSKCVIKRCIFTGEAIAKIRSSITEPAAAAYTRVELVMALVTKSLTNIMEEPAKHNNPLVISLPMNFRSKITQLPPIQENTCGNLITSVLATCGQLDDGLLSWDLPQLANIIRNSIQNVASQMSQLRDWTELSAMVVEACLNFEDEILKGDSVNLVIITSLCKLPLYQFDFGWGRPTLVTILPLPHNIIRLMDSKTDVAGVEVLACLKEQDMARFQQDQHILKYASF